MYMHTYDDAQYTQQEANKNINIIFPNIVRKIKRLTL